MTGLAEHLPSAFVDKEASGPFTKRAQSDVGLHDWVDMVELNFFWSIFSLTNVA